MDFYIVEIVGFVLVVIWFIYRDVSNLYEIRILQKRCRLIESEVMKQTGRIDASYILISKIATIADRALDINVSKKEEGWP